MHKLRKKKGGKTTTHHFSHVTEPDDKKKHVYLGTKPKQAKDKLTKLRVERVRSHSKVMKDAEEVKAKLQKLGHHNKSYDQVLSEATMMHYKQKSIDRMFGDDFKTPFPTTAIVILLALTIVLGGFAYLAFTEPTMTGAAVNTVASLAGRQVVSTSAGILVVIIILGFVLHRVDHHHKHRHDKYKHPKMLE